MDTSKKKSTSMTIENVELKFGGIKALNGVNIEIRENEIVALIGPNGAGKTCILNSVSGFYHPSAGKIVYKDRDITKLRPDKIARLGIARSFQNIQLFTGLSTVENLMAGRHIKMKQNLIQEALYFGPAQREEVRNRAIVEDIIDFFELAAIRTEVVGSLAYGLRKRVDLARALAQEPELLLLDEPMAGMNAEEKEDIARFIIDIYERKKIPIVLVEHDMGVVMDIADKVVVLNFGEVIAEGTPVEIKSNPKVIEAYLGARDTDAI